MTAHIVPTFRGEVPLLTPRELPDDAAQVALNSRLFTGDLTAFQQFGFTKVLANTPGPVRTISLLGPYWLSFDDQVDIARGIIPGDTTYRTYITGLDVPRFTNLDLATGTPNGSAAEPYPFETRVLGVSAPDSVPTLAVGVDPTPTSFSVDLLDACDDLSTNWILSPGQTVSGNFSTQVTQDAVFGNPLPSFKVISENNTSTPAYAYRDFGTANATVIHASWDVNVVDNGPNDGAYVYSMFACGSAGDGARIYIGRKYNDPIHVGIALGTGFSSGHGSTLAYSTGSVVDDMDGDIWFTVEGTLTQNADGTSTVTATVYLGSVQLATITTTNVFTVGGLFGPMSAKGDDRLEVNYDNYHVQASGSTGAVITSVATSYVFTFVNDIGEESAPSLPSSTILRPDGVSVTVTTATVLPTGVSDDEGITTKNIYRSVTGSTGTVFRFVAEIPLAQADYVDVLADTELGDPLNSEVWAKPPDDLQGILALPNGVMAGFRRNQLCLSAQNQPHAWPVEYRLNTDTDIVGIANIDTTVIIGTESFLYVASGNDPAAYSMSKSEVPYAASSKLSFDYITELGVVFSGPDGLMSVLGVGQVKNLTEKVFTRRQWQALNPSSIVSVAHNDVYYMFWETDDDRGCYAVDLRSQGFGIVQMAFHASASYVDPIEDKLYLVLDSDTEPDDEIIPVQSQFLLTYAGGSDPVASGTTPPVDPDYVTALVRLSGNIDDYSTLDATQTYYDFETPATPIYSTSAPLLYGLPMLLVGPNSSTSPTHQYSLEIPVGAAEFGTGDFTIEGWYYWPTNPGLLIGYFFQIETPGGQTWELYYSGGLWYFSHNFGTIFGVVASVSSPLNALNYFSLQRRSGRLWLHINGVQQNQTPNFGSWTYAGDISGGAIHLGVQPQLTFGGAPNSYVGETRVSTGIAPYIGDYTVPAAPYPSPGFDEQVTLLMRGTGTITDYSNYAGTLAYFENTTDVAPVFSTTSPLLFGQPMLRVGSDTGGVFQSGVEVPEAQVTFGLGDFTVEQWVSWTSAGSFSLFSTPDAGGGGQCQLGYLHTLGRFFVMAGGSIQGYFNGILAAGLNFISFVRESGYTKLRVNGVAWQAQDVTLHNTSPGVDLSATNLIGSSWTFGGIRSVVAGLSVTYLGELRLTAGFARTDYAEPTEPFSSPSYVPPDPPVGTPGIDGLTIFEFEGDATQSMIYRWRSKLWLEPYPAFHSIAQVRAESYENLVARFYGDGVLLDEIVLDGDACFTLTPPDEAYDTFEMELLGTGTVRVFEAADDVTELI